MMTPSMFHYYSYTINKENKRFLFKRNTIPLIKMRKRISGVILKHKPVSFLKIRKWRNNDCIFLANPFFFFSNHEKTNTMLRIATWPIIYSSLLLKYWGKSTAKECGHKSNNLVFTLAYENFTFVILADLTVTFS